MIEGAIYTRADGTMFAYKSMDEEWIYHYICVTNDDDVIVKNFNGTGQIGKDVAWLVTPSQRERFFRRIHEAGLHYNQANKVVIHNNQIVEQ